MEDDSMAAPMLGGVPSQIVTGSVPTAIPNSATDGFRVPKNVTTVRTFIQYGAGVSACAIRKLTRNKNGGAWGRDASTDDLDPLTPSSGNEIRIWDIAPGDEITFQIVAVTGGTVTVFADAVE
jgi:hypothetical protein